MLVLSRGVKEIIFVDNGNERITISIESIIGHKVRIGIEAPPHFKILRQELLCLPLKHSGMSQE